MSRWVRRQRWFNRVYAFALAVECWLRGHNYAQHWTLMGLADPEGAATQARRHQVAYLADAGLLADTGWWEGVNDQWKSERSIRGGQRLSEFANPYRGDAPVAGGNGAVAAEQSHLRPTTHATVDSLTARLVAARAATDGYRSEAERLRELLDEANAKIERMEAL